jgi:hypothetical protein
MSQLSRTVFTTLTFAFLCLCSAVARADTVGVSYSPWGSTAQFSSSGTSIVPAPSVGFFQKDGDVICRQITLFDCITELGANPYVFSVAAGTLSFITLGLIQEDRGLPRGVTTGEINHPGAGTFDTTAVSAERNSDGRGVA